MEETVLTHLLSNVGIPAAMAFYVLFGVNKTLKELTAAINKLSNDVDKRISKLEDRVDHFIREVQHDNSQH